MITLHTWTTPNGRKPVIMLEELGWPYRIVPVNLHKDEQFKPEFLALSPNNKIPAMVDDEAGLTMFESGAILSYLAERSGKLLAPEGAARYQALVWLHWQIGGLGPMLGQLGYFSEQKDAAAIAHFAKEADRLLGVLDRQLAASRYVAGEDYTIADIACYTWSHAAAERLKGVLGEKLDNKPHWQRWLSLVGSRPAVQRGMAWEVA
ncbi:glutathione S-transferase family protein [Massilia endophytica]|uniref:glutathione S-transferase family protein n=1 Tax=Massilia endophytica TaxID=2899220 RepID=UPI001E39D444|nr:glutathione S-transferase N-terminal domain-containing protein [Massilia endophytica]UGQ45152.1 glutathione S-transferase N-terminal domain-containing protein [Massilia endophytica]